LIGRIVQPTYSPSLADQATFFTEKKTIYIDYSGKLQKAQLDLASDGSET